MPTKPKHISYFFLVATGIFLSTMDSSMINVALPFIMQSFSTTLARVEWVVLIYLLTISATLLIWGRLSDRFGKGIVYLIGMLVFSVGCLFCYFSNSLLLLVFCRCIQGIGAAMMMSTGPAIIRSTFPKEHIGKWLGCLGVATSMGLMSGPFLGGFLIHNFSWRIIFLVTVPVSFSVFLLGWIFLAGTLPRYIDENRKFDWFGSIFWVVVITSAVLLLNMYSHSSLSLKIVGPFLVTALILLFYRYESKQSNPLFPVVLLEKRYYFTAMFSSALSFAILFIVLILMPFYLSYVKGFTSNIIGYMMMAVPVTLFIVSPLSGRMFDRIGAKYLTSLGLLVTCVAVLLLSMLQTNSTIFDICWRLSLLGCGQSIFLSPNTASVLSRVSLKNSGVTSGMLATCRNLGMLTGVALAGLAFSSLFFYFSDGQNLRDYTSVQMIEFMKSLRLTLWFAAFLAFFGSLISLRRE